MIITKTPFRISFFGGGTDYPVWYREHGGAVLGTTIDKYAYINCRYLPPFFKHKYRIAYSKLEYVKSLNSIEHPSVRECIRYVGIKSGLEIHYDSDLPAKSGLGSSSSFTVGLLNSLYTLKKQIVKVPQLADDAIYVEQKMIKESVGSQDQSHAAYGGFNHIEFNQNNNIIVNPVEIGEEKISLLNENILLFFTGFSRFASEVAIEQIKNTPNKQKELFEMQSLVTHALDILNGNINSIDDFGSLLHESWKMKKSLTNKISNDAIDEIYDTGIKAGALGGKLLGAGGGGFLILYATKPNQKNIIDKLKPLLHVPFKFEKEGSNVIFNYRSLRDYV